MLKQSKTIRNTEKVLMFFKTNLSNVVRKRMFVINIDQWEEIAKSHGEFFKDIKPVTTMVEIKRLINPEMLIEIEAEAVVDK